MGLLVLGYPNLEPGDYRWLQAIRADHDPLFRLVAPHFTLVFAVPEDAHGAAGVAEAELGAHVRQVARTLPRVTFILRHAAALREANDAYVWLVPTEGTAELAQIYDALHTDLLAPYRDAELPYDPHITVGRLTPEGADDRSAERLAGELNALGLALPGTLARLTVVRYENGLVTNLSEAPLLG
jgi:2'-5' RNA ligase